MGILDQAILPNSVGAGMAAKHSGASGTPGASLPDCDLLLVGGGLANGLIAWRLRQLRPDWRVMLIEQESQLGGNHTWSFHEGDLTAAQHDWIAPLVQYRWPAHEVVFNAFSRRIETGYFSVTSERFNASLRAFFHENDTFSAHFGAYNQVLLTGVSVLQVRPDSVTLDNGKVLRARAVIDARGPSVLASSGQAHLRLGWQKFLGQEVRLGTPHGLDAPLLMDARVPQLGGYRFVYVLPFTAYTVLVEDTCYADDAHVDAAGLRSRIADYIASRGWQVAQVLREESGVLPITLDGDAQAFWRAAGGQPRAGLIAGLFNPVTGYSLPDAVRLADHLAALDEPPDATALFERISGHALGQWRRHAYYRLLNRMLFWAAEPAARWRVMQRFYGLPAPLIARFYAGRLNLADKARILTGKPPVPLRAAWHAAWGRKKPLNNTAMHQAPAGPLQGHPRPAAQPGFSSELHTPSRPQEKDDPPTP